MLDAEGANQLFGDAVNSDTESLMRPFGSGPSARSALPLRLPLAAWRRRHGRYACLALAGLALVVATAVLQWPPRGESSMRAGDARAATELDDPGWACKLHLGSCPNPTSSPGDKHAPAPAPGGRWIFQPLDEDGNPTCDCACSDLWTTKTKTTTTLTTATSTLTTTTDTTTTTVATTTTETDTTRTSTTRTSTTETTRTSTTRTTTSETTTTATTITETTTTRSTTTETTTATTTSRTTTSKTTTTQTTLTATTVTTTPNEMLLDAEKMIGAGAHSRARQGGHSAPGQGGHSAPGQGDHSTPGQGGHSAPGQGGHSAPGQGGHSAPGQGGHSAPGQGGHSAPGQGDHSTPGEGDHSTPGQGDHPTAGQGDHSTPGKGDHPTGGQGGLLLDAEKLIGAGAHSTAGEGEHSTPGEHPTAGKNPGEDVEKEGAEEGPEHESAEHGDDGPEAESTGPKKGRHAHTPASTYPPAERCLELPERLLYCRSEGGNRWPLCMGIKDGDTAEGLAKGVIELQDCGAGDASYYEQFVLNHTDSQIHWYPDPSKCLEVETQNGEVPEGAKIKLANCQEPCEVMRDPTKQGFCVDVTRGAHKVIKSSCYGETSDKNPADFDKNRETAHTKCVEVAGGDASKGAPVSVRSCKEQEFNGGSQCWLYIDLYRKCPACDRKKVPAFMNLANNMLPSGGTDCMADNFPGGCNANRFEGCGKSCCCDGHQWTCKTDSFTCGCWRPLLECS